MCGEQGSTASTALSSVVRGVTWAFKAQSDLPHEACKDTYGGGVIAVSVMVASALFVSFALSLALVRLVLFVASVVFPELSDGYSSSTDPSVPTNQNATGAVLDGVVIKGGASTASLKHTRARRPWGAIRI